MKHFKKKGFWVFYVAIVLAGAFIIVALGLQNQSPVIPNVSAQINELYQSAPGFQAFTGSYIDGMGSFGSFGSYDLSNLRSSLAYRPSPTIGMCIAPDGTWGICEDGRTMSTCPPGCIDGKTQQTCSQFCRVSTDGFYPIGPFTDEICPLKPFELPSPATLDTCYAFCGGNTRDTCFTFLCGVGGGIPSMLICNIPTPGRQTYGSALCVGGQTYGSVLLCEAGGNTGTLLCTSRVVGTCSSFGPSYIPYSTPPAF